MSFLVRSQQEKLAGDEQTLVDLWHSNLFFSQANEMLITAWQRGFQQDTSPVLNTKFDAQIRTLIPPSAGYAASQITPYEGVCDSCILKRTLTWRIFPNADDRTRFLEYGSECGPLMAEVHNFVDIWRFFCAELRVTGGTLTRYYEHRCEIMWKDVRSCFNKIENIHLENFRKHKS